MYMGDRKNIIHLEKDGEVEVWGSVAKVCEVYEFSYNYLKRLKFPFTYKKIKFNKVPFDSKNVNLKIN